MKIIRLLFVIQDDVGVVFMSTDTRHGFEDGSYVTFHGVKGMEEVNDQEFKINVTSSFSSGVIFEGITSSL